MCLEKESDDGSVEPRGRREEGRGVGVRKKAPRLKRKGGRPRDSRAEPNVSPHCRAHCRLWRTSLPPPVRRHLPFPTPPTPLTIRYYPFDRPPCFLPSPSGSLPASLPACLPACLPVSTYPPYPANCDLSTLDLPCLDTFAPNCLHTYAYANSLLALPLYPPASLSFSRPSRHLHRFPNT